MGKAVVLGNAVARFGVFAWRRVSDLNTLLWIFPGGAALVTAALSLSQRVPLALLFVLSLSAFLIVLAAVVLWRTHFGKRFPHRHKEILQTLAGPLAQVQELSMAYGPRDRAAIREATVEAEALVAEIPYDDATSETVRQFLRFCELVVHDSEMRWDDRENRDIAHRIGIVLFRYLHEGRPVDRRKIKLPDWLLGAGHDPNGAQPISAPALPPHQVQPPAVAQDQAGSAITFDQAFAERASDRIPYVRIRELAPAYGLGLGLHDPEPFNVAYRIEGALRQAAVDKELKVWGRKYRGRVKSNDPVVSIPASHFGHFEFGHGNLHYESPNEQTHTGKIGKRLEDFPDQAFYDLRLSLKDTEAVLSKVSRGVVE